ncbi:MAG: type IV secretory system conjugative DNA transfer family protein, partial [Alteromonadaceae bacterium]|nr:type IV secretory system conjugative DNA transfer family protein [Alteromonadaceae bacterium]
MAEMTAAGLFKKGGFQLGFKNNVPLFFDTPAPVIITAGSGSGKGAKILVYNVVRYEGNILVNDDKGELFQISKAHHHKIKIKARCYNPNGKHGLPQHRCNPLDILKENSKYYHSDVECIVENILPLSGSSGGKYFEECAQRWLSSFIKFEVSEWGKTSFSSLYDFFGVLEANPDIFATVTDKMKQGSTDVALTGAEMVNLRNSGDGKRYGDIMSEIYNAFKPLSQPNIYEFLKGGDGSLEDPFTSKQRYKDFIILPPAAAAIKRAIITTSMLYKERHGQAAPIMLLLDEAGQLGNFPEFLKACTFGQGIGVKLIGVFQDSGQMIKNYGESGPTTIYGSGQQKVYFGIRNLADAKSVSEQLGTFTYKYTSSLRQEQAQHNKQQEVWAILNGKDPVQSLLEAAHAEKTYEIPDAMAKLLMSPDEVLRLASDKMIIGSNYKSGKKRPLTHSIILICNNIML